METQQGQRWTLLLEKIWFTQATTVLENHTFRNKGPQSLNESLGGRVHIGQKISTDGNFIGQIKSLRTRSSEDVKQGHQGESWLLQLWALPLVGKSKKATNFGSTSILTCQRLRKLDLTPIEEEILKSPAYIVSRTTFWGRQ